MSLYRILLPLINRDVKKENVMAHGMINHSKTVKINASKINLNKYSSPYVNIIN